MKSASVVLEIIGCPFYMENFEYNNSIFKQNIWKFFSLKQVSHFSRAYCTKGSFENFLVLEKLRPFEA